LLAEALRLNTTVTSLNLYYNNPGEGGLQALSETLRVNTTLASFWEDDQGPEGYAG
jgi:hypothetical protein